MIIKKRVDFKTFNRVINTLDYMISKPEYNLYDGENCSSAEKLKDRFLRYSMLHFSNTDVVHMNFTEYEFGEFYFLLGFSYSIYIDEENEIDYIKQLQDKYDNWVKENPEKRGKDSHGRTDW